MGAVRKIPGMRSRMVRAALCLGSLLPIMGCSPSRQLLKAQRAESREAERAAAARTEASLAVRVRSADELERDEQVVTVTTLYDTSRPADPTTGRPPVREHTTQVRRTAAKVRQETSAENRQQQLRTERQAAAEKIRTTAAAAEERRRGPSGMQRLLCAIGLLAAGGIAGRLLRLLRLRRER